MNEKIQFAGPAWIDQARLVLEDLVAEQGEDGERFSVCEIFTVLVEHLHLVLEHVHTARIVEVDVADVGIFGAGSQRALPN